MPIKNQPESSSGKPSFVAATAPEITLALTSSTPDRSLARGRAIPIATEDNSIPENKAAEIQPESLNEIVEPEMDASKMKGRK